MSSLLEPFQHRNICHSWETACGPKYSIADKPRLRIVAFVFIPFVQACFKDFPSPSCQDPGIELNLIYSIVRSLGFNVSFVVVDDQAEMVEAIRDGRGDIAGITQSAIPQDGEREAGISVTSQVMTEMPIFFYSAEQSSHKPTQLIFGSPDKGAFWLINGAVFGILYAVVKLAGRLELLYLGRLSKASLLFCSLGLSLFLGMYSNTLAIVLSHSTTLVGPFETLLEYSRLLAYGKCRLVANSRLNTPTNYLYQFLRPSFRSPLPAAHPDTKEMVANLLAAYESNPPIWVRSEEEMIGALLKTSECRIGLGFRSQQPLLEASFCGLRYMTPEGLRGEDFVYYTREGVWDEDRSVENLLEAEYAIRRFQVAKVAEYAEKRRRVKESHWSCNRSIPAEEKRPGLDLVELSEAFGLLALYLVAAGVFLLYEGLYTRLWGRRMDEKEETREEDNASVGAVTYLLHQAYRLF